MFKVEIYKGLFWVRVAMTKCSYRIFVLTYGLCTITTVITYVNYIYEHMNTCIILIVVVILIIIKGFNY